MSNDPRRMGGQEYAPQPSMRPLPQSQGPHGYAEPQPVTVPYEQLAP